MTPDPTPAPTRPGGEVRTYSDDLRRLDAAGLTTLLRWRPDLSHPVPQDFTDLAARAATGSSVARALRHLDAWLEVVVEALAALPDGPTLDEVAELLGPDPDHAAVALAIDRLRARGLVWGEADRPRLLRAARAAAGTFAGGLAPPSPTPLSAATIDEAVGGLDDSARQLVDKLVWGPPTGRVVGARSRHTGSDTIGALLGAGLLRAVDDDTVLLPREVAWRLRDPRRLVRQLPPPTVPALRTTPAARPTLTDRLAVGAAYELVADAEAVCEVIAGRALRILRDGGLAVREVSGLAADLQLQVDRARFLLEVCHAAGLVTPSAQQTLLPTTAYDHWLAQDPPRRWELLVAGWRESRRWAAWTTEPARHVLGPEAAWSTAPEVRSTALEELARVEPGAVVEPDSLEEVLGWHRPGWRRAGWSLPEVVVEFLGELEQLGVLAGGAVSALLGGARPDGELDATVTAEFPALGHDIVLQADLTAVTGPLAHQVGRELRLLANAESRGAAAVFRFSADSLRRAFDAGWSHLQISTWLTEHSRSPVPQPLEYLVGEVARRHGSVRVGQAWSYVRTEDDTQALTVLNHPDASSLGLRAVAPGVLVASAEAGEVVELLRDLGLHPAAEDESGRTLTAPAPVRAPAPRPTETPTADPATVADRLLADAVRTAAFRNATEDVLGALNRGIRLGHRLDISYVAADGTNARTVAVPQVISAGTVRLAAENGMLTMPLARISGAVRYPEPTEATT